MNKVTVMIIYGNKEKLKDLMFRLHEFPPHFHWNEIRARELKTLIPDLEKRMSLFEDIDTVELENIEITCIDGENLISSGRGSNRGRKTDILYVDSELEEIEDIMIQTKPAVWCSRFPQAIFEY